MAQTQKQKDNLINLSDRSPEKAKEIRSKGGKARQEQRKAQKSFRDLLQACLDLEQKNAQTGETKSLKDLGMLRLANQVSQGNLKAIKLAAEIMGEYKQKINLDTEDSGLVVVVRSKETADKLQKVIDLENGDE
jgi:hypothetical protein